MLRLKLNLSVLLVLLVIALEIQCYQSIYVKLEWIFYTLLPVLLAFALQRNILDRLYLSIYVSLYCYKIDNHTLCICTVVYYFCIHIFGAFFMTFRAGLNIHFQNSSICFYKSKDYTRKTLLFFSLPHIFGNLFVDSVLNANSDV